MPQITDNFEEKEFEELIHDGIAAVKGGQRGLARTLLNKAIQIKSADARPWIWLTATTDDPEEQRQYLGNAVAAEPGNATARRGLVLLSQKLDKSRLVDEGAAVEPRHPTSPEDAQSQSFACPRCGGRMSFDIHQEGLVCHYCGYIQATEQELAAESAEQPIDFVMPTTRAHRWAEAQQRVCCERCGAVTLLPPGQKADQCPYCGSNRLVGSTEAVELVDPQVIGLMKIDAQEAIQRVKGWLGKGLFTPDDLALRAGGFHFSPAYYPFWTFDGALELNWKCEVNEGTSKYPHWVTRSGSDTQFFDDVLVPGLRVLSPEDAAAVEPFNLKELVEFKAEFLAGWPALTYDRPLADASLMAREKVLKTQRDSLYHSVGEGHQKRNFSAGAGGWSGLTFKHVLLPLWVGTYHFQGKDYRMLVNGQTGKVGGKKPRDSVKIAGVGFGAGIVLVVIAFLLYWWWVMYGQALIQGIR